MARAGHTIARARHTFSRAGLTFTRAGQTLPRAWHILQFSPSNLVGLLCLQPYQSYATRGGGQRS
jgi:hypothetical protein